MLCIAHVCCSACCSHIIISQNHITPNIIFYSSSSAIVESFVYQLSIRIEEERVKGRRDCNIIYGERSTTRRSKIVRLTRLGLVFPPLFSSWRQQQQQVLKGFRPKSKFWMHLYTEENHRHRKAFWIVLTDHRSNDRTIAVVVIIAVTIILLVGPTVVMRLKCCRNHRIIIAVIIDDPRIMPGMNLPYRNDPNL